MIDFFKKMGTKDAKIDINNAGENQDTTNHADDGLDPEQVRKAAEDAYDKELPEIERLRRENLVIGLIGDVNAGKSSTINAITGRKLAEVSAFSGSTTEVELHEFAKNVFIGDTPGLNDINEENSKKAKDFVHDKTDIILFFFKASGIGKHDIEMCKNVMKLGKPVIAILNYIDVWYTNPQLSDRQLTEPESLNTVVNQIKKATGIDPVPISAKHGINIDKLNAEILRILEDKGKDLLFLKISKYREEKVAVWINGATVTAAGIGALPIPGADILPLTALQVALAIKIGFVYDIKVTKADVAKLLASTVTGSIGKQIYRLTLEVLKGAGWLGGPFGEGAVMIAAAAIAGSITYGFGWACNAYYKSGMTMDLGQFAELFDTFRRKKVDHSRVKIWYNSNVDN